jgi:hypothetical protein
VLTLHAVRNALISVVSLLNTFIPIRLGRVTTVIFIADLTLVTNLLIDPRTRIP